MICFSVLINFITDVMTLIAIFLFSFFYFLDFSFYLLSVLFASFYLHAHIYFLTYAMITIQITYDNLYFSFCSYFYNSSLVYYLTYPTLHHRFKISTSHIFCRVHVRLHIHVWIITCYTIRQIVPVFSHILRLGGAVDASKHCVEAALQEVS